MILERVFIFITYLVMTRFYSRNIFNRSIPTSSILYNYNKYVHTMLTKMWVANIEAHLTFVYNITVNKCRTSYHF